MTTEKKDIDTREFEGRVALITGAATGLGYVIAQEFHARGAFTVMVDQSNEVKEKASVLGSSRVLGLTADLTVRKEVEAARKEILRTCGTIDTVVNNVGKYTPVAISDITEDDLNNIDVVVHLAGISNDPMSKMDSKKVYDPTRIYTKNLAKLCKSKGIRFILQDSPLRILTKSFA